MFFLVRFIAGLQETPLQKIHLSPKKASSLLLVPWMILLHLGPYCSVLFFLRHNLTKIPLGEGGFQSFLDVTSCAGVLSLGHKHKHLLYSEFLLLFMRKNHTHTSQICGGWYEFCECRECGNSLSQDAGYINLPDFELHFHFQLFGGDLHPPN